MATGFLREAAPASRIYAGLWIILVYAAFGPPLGWAVLAAFFAVSAVGKGIVETGIDTESVRALLKAVPAFLAVLSIGGLLSYVFGLIPAFLTGVALAAWHGASGRAGYAAAFVAALAAGLIARTVNILDNRELTAFSAGLICAGLASSLILRFFFRGLFAKAPRPA